MPNRHIERPGFTMIEVMIALGGFLVAVVGALSFQYYCAVDTREADVRAGANRVALLMLEGWRGSGGRVTGPYAYNPIEEFGPLAATDGPLEFIGPTDEGLDAIDPELGRYKVVANRTNYFVTLSYNDTVATTLRTLGVTVAWSRDYKAESLDRLVRSVALTTFAEVVAEAN
jgi:type II secretory pathway pseudopilin PulG